MLTDASLLIGLGRLDEADRVLSEMLDRATEVGDLRSASQALEGLGTVATRRGQEARALQLFEQAIERGDRPDPVERESLYTHTARLRSFSGDAGGAVTLVEECLGRVSSEPDADPAVIAHYSITLSYAYADAGQYGRSNSVLAGVLRDGGEDLDLRVRQRLYYALTRLNMNIGRSEQAIEYSEKNLETAVASDSHDVFDAYLQCAHVRLDANDTELAGRYLVEARRRAPDPLGSVDAGFLLVEEARFSLQQGDHDTALSRAGAAVELLADDPSGPGQSGLAHLVIARVHDDRGVADAADPEYRLAIDSLERQTGWPTELAKAYRRYGKFLRQRGQLDEAMRMLELASDTSV
jgi:Tfp pilus assembly protein PilF